MMNGLAQFVQDRLPATRLGSGGTALGTAAIQSVDKR